VTASPDDKAAGPLSRTELDAVLAAAREECSRHVRAAVPLGAALLTIMETGSQAADRSRAQSGHPGQLRTGADHAFAYISARAVARDLCGQLDATISDLSPFREGWPGPRSPGGKFPLTDPPASLAASSVEFSAALADMLSGFLQALAPAGHAAGSTFLGEADRYVAREISKALALLRGPGVSREHEHLAAVHLVAASDFLGMILRMSLSDVSEMDLSGESFGDVDVLVGVTWTDGTCWPPAVAGWVRRQSKKLRPGVYLVQGGGTWNPAEDLVDA
jgi:hypothetical protein